MAYNEGQVVVMGQKSAPVVYASRSRPPPVFASRGKSTPFVKDDSQETASNYRTFRMLFGDDYDELNEKEEFVGFGIQDDLRKKCENLRNLIAREISKMEKQIKKAKELKRKTLAAEEKQSKKLKLESSEIKPSIPTAEGSAVTLPHEPVAVMDTSVPTDSISSCQVTKPVGEVPVPATEKTTATRGNAFAEDAPKGENLHAATGVVPSISKGQSGQADIAVPVAVSKRSSPVKTNYMQTTTTESINSIPEMGKRKSPNKVVTSVPSDPLQIQDGVVGQRTTRKQTTKGRKQVLRPKKELSASPRHSPDKKQPVKQSSGNVDEIKEAKQDVDCDIIKPRLPKIPRAKLSEVPSEESFIGFPVDSPLLLAVKQKLEDLNKLEKEDDFLGFPQDHPLRQKCILTLVKLNDEINTAADFIGFSDKDPLLKSVFDKYKVVVSELAEVIEIVKSKREIALHRKSPTKQVKEAKSSKNNSEMVSARKDKSNLNSSVDGADQPLRYNEPEDGGNLNIKKQVKVLLPNVKTNIEDVMVGPRIKNVRFCGGPGQTLPTSKFLPHQYPWDQDYGESNGGPSQDLSREILVDLSSDSAFRPDVGVEEEILLGRQRGTLGPRSGLIRAIVPFSVDDIADSGFPVVVTQIVPPKPLCFLCGSAGLSQLIFCSICCEPYHPFCTGDDALMASFVVLVCSSNQKRITGTPSDTKLQAHIDASRADDTETQKLYEKFNTWSCNRCLVCSSCGLNRRVRGKNKVKWTNDEFVKCSSCRDTYHTACLGKRYDDGLVEDFSGPPDSDDEGEKQWMCEKCAKCRSCGVKLDGGQDKKKKKNNLMLCLECFRRRQRGSFCPLCNVSYDENDYDTRMMECGVCQRWIHGKCEGISEEQYQVLSHLPESVEFVCKLCDKTRSPLWLQAVRMEILNGCESVLRMFVKKALVETRKRKSLNFDDLLRSDTSKVTLSPKIFKSDLESPATIELCLNGVEQQDMDCVVDKVVKNDRTEESLQEISPKLPLMLTEDNAKENKLILESNPVPKRGIRRSRRRNSSGKSVDNTCDKIFKSQSPVEIYETSDGSLVSLKECRVVVKDVLKNPSKECSRYVAVVKEPSEVDCEASTNVVSSSGGQISRANVFKPLENEPELYYHRQRLEDTPSKMDSLSSSILKTPIGPTPQILLTPSKKVMDFTDLVKKEVNVERCTSVMYFQEESLLLLDEYFEDAGENKRTKLQNEFKEAVKEVFSWFDSEKVENSDLPRYQVGEAFRYKISNPTAEGCESMDLNTVLINMDPFEDTYWNEDNIVDIRGCSFCGHKGDLAPDGCGRLLWAGLNEWIHVNCALWSSEVWEEESGALQQVGSALTRSRNMKCAYCKKTGASVSCCHGSCHKSYHFPCALNAHCGMKLDKMVFCKEHSQNIPRSSLQHEYQVHRKVFVDLEWIKKKEKPVLSGEVRVLIGSMKIESLGEIFPLSVWSGPVFADGQDTTLIPNEYQCSRLFWSHLDPFKKCQYQISGSIHNDWFRSYARKASHSEFNIVIDHSESVDIMRSKILQMNAFHSWISTAPKLIDEFDVEWIPHFPDEVSDCFPVADQSTECPNYLGHVCQGQTAYRRYYSVVDDHQRKKFKHEQKPINSFNIKDEPLTLDEYHKLYERIKDLNSILQDYLQYLDTSIVNKGGVYTKPETTRLPLNPKNCRDAFIEKLTLKTELYADDASYRKALMYNLLDGAVNDSNSDTNSSSSSSSSDSEAEDSGDVPSVTSSNSSNSEDREENIKIVHSRRITRRQTQIKNEVKRDTQEAGRRLRSRDKKSELVCTWCKKDFPSEGSLAQHQRWCKCKKTGNGRDSAAKVPLAETASTCPQEAPKKRGRPQKQSQVQRVSIQSQLPTTKISTRRRNNPVKIVTTTIFPKYEPKEIPNQQESTANANAATKVAVDDDDRSKTCKRCKLVYKTVESLKKHEEVGNCVSSEDEESVEEVEMTYQSRMELPESLNVAVAVNNYPQADESYNESSISNDEGCATDMSLDNTVNSEGKEHHVRDSNISNLCGITSSSASEEGDNSWKAVSLAVSKNIEDLASSSGSMGEQGSVEAETDVESEVSDVDAVVEIPKVTEVSEESSMTMEGITETSVETKANSDSCINSVHQGEGGGGAYSTAAMSETSFNESEILRHTSDIGSNQFQQSSMGMDNHSKGFFSSCITSTPNMNNTEKLGFQSFPSDCDQNLRTIVTRQELASIIEAPHHGNNNISLQGLTQYASVHSGMTVTSQNGPVEQATVQNLPILQSSSSQSAVENMDMNPMNINYCMYTRMAPETPTQPLMVGDNLNIMNSLAYTGMTVAPNQTDFVTYGNQQSHGMQQQFQPHIDSSQQVQQSSGFNPVPDSNCQQHNAFQCVTPSRNTILSWSTSESSPSSFVNSQNVHAFQQQFNPQMQNNSQLRIPQHPVINTQLPTQLQSPLQQMNICSPAVVATEIMHQAPVGDLSASMNPQLPSCHSSCPGTGSTDGNVAYVVVQHGNTYSTIPVNPSLQHHGNSVNPHGLHPGQPNLNLLDIHKQQSHCMHVTPNVIPLASPAPAMLSMYSAGQQSQPQHIHNLNVQPGFATSCMPRDGMDGSSIPQHLQTRHPCSCGKGQQEQCSLTSQVMLKQQVHSADSSSYATVIPKPILQSDGVMKQVIIDNKRVALRPTESMQTNVCPPMFSSPNKRDMCNIPVGSTLSPGSAGYCTDSSAAAKTITSSNIAVVRPMENPLQKMSNQVAQIEMNFNNPSIPTPATQADTGVRYESFSEESRRTDFTLRAQAADVFKTVQIGKEKEEDVHTPLVRPQISKKVALDTIMPKTILMGKVIKQDRDTKGKSIKVTLKRKQGGDSYSINDVTESGEETSGSMRSLKIKAKIKSGELAGMATDVIVTPLIQAIPIVSEIKTTNGQQTGIGYDEEQGLVCTVTVPNHNGVENSLINAARTLPLTSAGVKTNPVKVTHRAMIVYEVKCNEVVVFRSSDVRAVWGHIFEVVQGTRLKHKLPPLPYPATSISLPENQRGAANSFNMLGLTHQAVQFLLEQLPGTNSVMEKHKFKFHHPKFEEESLPPANPTGCARTQPFVSRKPFDMFGWLASKHRNVPALIDTPTEWANKDLPMAMRYRNLNVRVKSDTLGVFYSAIHGRGLFTRRDIQEGEMIIEYAGELIRTILSDLKEKYYESKGIGCYFFTIDEKVIIDATMKGNAARFINHSCEPNCRSKSVDIFGKKHILIFAERKIFGGEELTYDYKFAVESDDKKIPCTCGARKCRKYLN